MADFQFFEVGGHVRDGLLGISSKDIDFTAVDIGAGGDIDASFARLETRLGAEGFEIFLSTPEFLTVRARFPKTHKNAGMTADFVLARKEGPYTDGRRPDWVVPGTLSDDLARRDFTVNAIAKSLSTGEIIDPFNGRFDLEHMTLKCVGKAEDRLREDALRALRAVRFAITKGFHLNIELQNVLQANWLPELLSSVSADRKRDELDKCFKTDTIKTLDLLWSFSPEFVQAVFTDGLRLKPTMEK